MQHGDEIVNYMDMPEQSEPRVSSSKSKKGSLVVGVVVGLMHFT